MMFNIEKWRVKWSLHMKDAKGFTQGECSSIINYSKFLKNAHYPKEGWGETTRTLVPWRQGFWFHSP